MKKTLAIILAVVFIVALAGTVYAETQFKLGGDARVQGTWQKNYDFDSSSPKNDERWWDYRVRLTFDATADGGSAVHVRLATTGGDQNSYNEIWGNPVMGGAPGSYTTNSLEQVGMDYAYIDVPLTKDVTATLGKVVVNWGDKFWSWDNRAYRAIFGGKVGDTTIKVFTQKNTETSNSSKAGLGAETATHKNLSDDDAYSALAIYNAKGLELGAIYVYWNNKAVESSAASYTNGKTGSSFDMYGNYSAGPLGLAGEVVTEMGDVRKYNSATKSANKYGGFLQATYGLGNTTLAAAVAMSKNGYVADDDFTPTYFFGTTSGQRTGLINFGQLGDTSALVVAAIQQFTPELSGLVRGAYASIKSFDGSLLHDAKVMEGDLGMTYKINKSTTYEINLGYLKPKDFYATKVLNGPNDAAIALAHKINISF